MSSKCDSCTCDDPKNCPKKPNPDSYDVVIVETENRSMDTVVMDAPANENHGKCKCCPCVCVNCKCGH